MKINYEELMQNDTQNAKLYEKILIKAKELAQKNTNIRLDKTAREQARQKFETESNQEDYYKIEGYYEEKNKILHELISTKYDTIYREEYDNAIKELLKKYSLKNCLICKEATYKKIESFARENGKWPNRKEIRSLHRKVVKNRIGLALGLSSALGIGVGATIANQVNEGNNQQLEQIVDGKEKAQEIVKESQKIEREDAFKEIFSENYNSFVNYEKLLNYLKQRVAEVYNAEYGENISTEDVEIWMGQYGISLHEDKAEDGSTIVRLDEQLNDTGKYQSSEIIKVSINGEEIIATKQITAFGFKRGNFVKVYQSDEKAETAEENILTQYGLAELLESGIELYDTNMTGIKDSDIESFKEIVEEYDNKLLENEKVEVDNNGTITIQYGVSTSSQSNITNDEINWKDGLKVTESSVQETTIQPDNYNIDETFAVDLEENDEVK